LTPLARVVSFFSFVGKRVLLCGGL
jgi:hypothetical protein